MWLYEKLINMYNDNENQDKIINETIMISVETQTDFETNFTFDTNTFNYSNKSFFKHLEFANQTYWEHFNDSMSYFFQSCKSSFFFLFHALWPDIYITSGSETIHNLSQTIKNKYKRRIQEILTTEQV